jgi:YrbI family 3-deoxy-D-manno-octulosonate 8-phosphate phosphatase
MTGDCILPLMIASRYAVDIDSAIHWQIAEAVLASGELAVVEPERTMGANLEGIRLLVFDFDGVFTDNTVITTQDGAEAVICSREDGLGIERLLSRGIDAAVLSTEENPVVAARCRKLKLSFVQGLSDKGQGLRDLASTKGLGVDQVAYVGNDRNDLECLKIARVALVPADAHPSIRGMADVVLRHRGGHGAVREACELAIAAHNGGEAHERTANR